MTHKHALGLTLALLAAPAFAAPAAQTAGPFNGRWAVTAKVFGTELYQRIDFEQHGAVLGGKQGGDPLEGVVTGDKVHFVVTQADGARSTVDAVLKDGELTGEGVDTDPANHFRDRYVFSAMPYPARPAGPPVRHELTPTEFHRFYSALTKPALTISPGDTVHTTTVDAGGTDEKGVARVLGGNPQTGPFFVRSAMPGDTLVVHITRLKLNRDYAVSDDAVVPRGLDPGLAVRMAAGGKTVRWHLDIANGLASVEKPGEHMARYTVPVRPMLGCIATAPAPSRGAPLTGDSGNYGGNMDFNEIVDGATVYLPVSVPGALLYLGDGHAAQGDGEMNGNALETSLDVEFTVEVIPGRRFPAPRVESASHIMAMGLDGSLDDAFRQATSNMSSWLANDYKLTPAEIAEVIGSAAEYKVSEAADRNAGVVLKLSKERLKGLRAP